MGFKIDSKKSWTKVGKKSISSDTYKPIVEAKSYEPAEVVIQADTYKPIIEAESYKPLEVLIEAKTYEPIIEEKSYTPIVQEETYTGKAKRTRKPRGVVPPSGVGVQEPLTTSASVDSTNNSLSISTYSQEEVNDDETMVVVNKSKSKSDGNTNDLLLYGGIGMAGAFVLAVLMGGDRR
jgi:hypothetical protein